MKTVFGYDVLFIKRTVIAALLIVSCGAYSSAASQDGGTLSGEIRTVDGAPAATVRVVAVSAKNLASAAEAQTDAAGRYRLRDIQPGEYLVVVVGSDVLTYYPGARSREHARVLAVGEAATMTMTGVDFRAEGVRVSGHVAVPEGLPDGVLRVALSGGDPRVAGLVNTLAPLRGSGHFEFYGMRPGAQNLGVELLAAGRSFDVPEMDVDDVELNPPCQGRQDCPVGHYLLGRIVVEGGLPLPLNADYRAPSPLRLHAKETGGPVFPSLFVRSDGIVAFLPLPEGEYRIEFASLPERFAVKSMFYGAVNLLEKPLPNIPDRERAFINITLAPKTILPADGRAMVVVTASGAGPGYVEGAHMMFRFRSPDTTHEYNFGGEECPMPTNLTLRIRWAPPSCMPAAGTMVFDSLRIPLTPGAYEVTSYLIGSMGGKVEYECRTAVTLLSGATVYLERVHEGVNSECQLITSSKPFR